MAILRWLHLSDWHQGGGDFDREVVVDALFDDINTREAIDTDLAQIDFVFFTGDLAYSGKKQEYDAAREILLNPLIDLLKLPKERLFIIPGNHDLDRDDFRFLPAELTKPIVSRQTVNEWLENSRMRSKLLEPFSAYQQFVTEFDVPAFGSYGDYPSIQVNDITIGIVGVNSALMCGRNVNLDGKISDSNHLTVGEPQIHHALRAIKDADIRIGLVHHPFDWLAEEDREIVETRFQEGCDFILRGHVHRQSVQVTKSTSGDCVAIPGGACFDGRVPYRTQYINAYNFVVYDTDSREGTVYFRRWSLNNTGWMADADLAKDGKYTFFMPRSLSGKRNEKETTHSVEDSNVLSGSRWANIRDKYLGYMVRQCANLNARGIAQTERTVTLPLIAVYVSLSAVQTMNRAVSVIDGLNESDWARGTSFSVPLAASQINFPSIEPLPSESNTDVSARAELSPEFRVSTGTLIVDASLFVTNVLNASAHVARKDECWDVVRRERLALLLGKPGSGKTTLARFVAGRFVEACLVNAPTAIDAAGNDYGETRLPILLRVAGFAEALRANTGLSLRGYLSQPFADTGIPAADRTEYFHAALQQGKVLILLDGLDEVKTTADRVSVVRQIDSFVNGLEKGCRVLVTSRIIGYAEVSLGNGFEEYEIQDMDTSQIRQFLDQWCVAVERFQTPNAGDAQNQQLGIEESVRLQNAIAGSDGVRRLATNPLLLTILALIHRNQKRLPARRIELYRIASDTLLRDWRTAQTEFSGVEITEAEAETLLEPLAHWMHGNVDTGLLDRDEARNLLCKFDAESRGLSPTHPDVRARIDDFLTRIYDHSGLFVMHSTGKVGFLHQTFQEYFAARYIASDFDRAKILLNNYRNKARWTEPVRLAIASQTGPNAAKLLRATLWDVAPSAKDSGYCPSPFENILHRDLLLALLCLGDCSSIEPSLARDIEVAMMPILLHPENNRSRAPLHDRLLEVVPGLAESDIGKAIELSCLGALKIFSQGTLGVVHASAILALERLGRPIEPVVAAVLIALKDVENDPVGHTRVVAASALANMNQASAEIIDTLLTTLETDPYSYVHLGAAHALGQLGRSSNRVILRLIHILQDFESGSVGSVRGGAAIALGHAGNYTEPVLDALLTSLNEDSDVYVRGNSAAALGRIGRSSERVITSLMSSLNGSTDDTDSFVSGSAAIALGDLGQVSDIIVSELLRAVFAPSGGFVRGSAARALGLLGYASADVVSTLLSVLRNPETATDHYLRGSAAIALGSLGQASGTIEETLIYTLVTLEDDSDGYVRSCAASALGQLGHSSAEVIEALTHSLDNDAFAIVQSKSASALGQLRMSSESVVDALLRAVDSNRQGYVRGSAALALAQLGQSSDVIVNALVNILQNTDNDPSGQCYSGAWEALNILSSDLPPD